MSTESERLAELVTDLGHRLTQAFGDVVSPEAQRHLRNAQREALTALFMIYEEQLGRRTGRTSPAPAEDDRDDWPQDMEEALRWAGADEESDAELEGDAPPPPKSRARRPRPRPAKPARPASRVKKIDLD